MGTRGLTGFIADGKWFVTYNHSDSYPEYLGMKVLEFCKQVEDWDALRENVLALTLVSEYEDAPPTDEEMEEPKGPTAGQNTPGSARQGTKYSGSKNVGY